MDLLGQVAQADALVTRVVRGELRQDAPHRLVLVVVILELLQRAQGRGPAAPGDATNEWRFSIYRVVGDLPEVLDSLVVDLEYLGRESWMPLFVALRDAPTLDAALEQRIRTALSAHTIVYLCEPGTTDSLQPHRQLRPASGWTKTSGEKNGSVR